MAMQYIPDTQGTIVVKDQDGSAKRFKTDDAFLKQLTERMEEAKETFRQSAEQVKQHAGPGAKRILFSDGQGGGVMCGLPDLEKDGTYTNLAAKEISGLLAKAGGLDAAGIPEAELVKKEEAVTLTGAWAVWFRGQIEVFKQQSESIKARIASGEAGLTPFDVNEDGIDYRTTLKLKPEALDLLKQRANTDGQPGEVAKLLLENGLRKMTVTTK